jgi:hypothetical protein
MCLTDHGQNDHIDLPPHASIVLGADLVDVCVLMVDDVVCRRVDIVYRDLLLRVRHTGPRFGRKSKDRKAKDFAMGPSTPPNCVVKAVAAIGRYAASKFG